MTDLVEKLHVLSLGAGVQSTTMALMAAHGEITPMPDCAIFADTRAEKRRTYEHLTWLANELPFPVHWVTISDLADDLIKGTNSTGQKFSPVPWFTINSDGTQGMGRRQCTREYKLIAIRRKISEMVGTRKKPGAVSQWIGLDRDEIAWRRKPSDVAYIENRWPLADEHRMTRANCAAWLWDRYKRIAPRSACVFCPFQSDEEWRDVKSDKFDWELVLKVDEGIRSHGDIQFMHVDRKPIDEVALSDPKRQLNLFNNECEGMCGV